MDEVPVPASLLEIIEKAGIENMFAEEEGWVAISEEVIIEKNPELIVTTVNYTEDDPVEEIKSRTGWESITAVAEDHVYEVDAEITSRPGPRIAEAVEILAELAYPEAFAN